MIFWFGHFGHFAVSVITDLYCNNHYKKSKNCVCVFVVFLSMLEVLLFLRKTYMHNKFILKRHCSTSIKLYGHFFSQPTRSVVWLLKNNNITFDFIKVDPSNDDTKQINYISKFPTALAPAIDDNGFYLAESSAIMIYLCNKYQLNKWFPLDSTITAIQQRAKINEYLSYHHLTSRYLTINIARPFIRSLTSGTKWSRQNADMHTDTIINTAKQFQSIFLNSGAYVNGISHPTIADLLAYPEYAQISQLGIFDYNDNSDLEVFNKWLSNMSKLPEHDNIHQTVFKVAKMGGLCVDKKY
jgi:glutathione S-transferase